MKIYEKPMAIIEKIDVEDVITTSPAVANQDAYGDAYADLRTAAGTDNAIIFEW